MSLLLTNVLPKVDGDIYSVFPSGVWVLVFTTNSGNVCESIKFCSSHEKWLCIPWLWLLVVFSGLFYFGVPLFKRPVPISGLLFHWAFRLSHGSNPHQQSLQARTSKVTSSNRLCGSPWVPSSLIPSKERGWSLLVLVTSHCSPPLLPQHTAKLVSDLPQEGFSPRPHSQGHFSFSKSPSTVSSVCCPWYGLQLCSVFCPLINSKHLEARAVAYYRAWK